MNVPITFKEEIPDTKASKKIISPLPCEGEFKPSAENGGIDYRFCKTQYQFCPNQNCIMNLV